MKGTSFTSRHALALVAFAGLVACFVWTGCATRPVAREVAGNYVHRETGGRIVFRANGEFYYSFTTPSEGLPRNRGYYDFESATDAQPNLRVRSAHVGQFRIRIAESGEQVFLTHPNLFAGERVYVRQ